MGRQREDEQESQVMTDQNYMRPGVKFAMGKAVEEAGEFLAAMGKTMRWGWGSFNPELLPHEQETNASWVRREMADLRHALDNLEREMDRVGGRSLAMINFNDS